MGTGNHGIAESKESLSTAGIAMDDSGRTGELGRRNSWPSFATTPVATPSGHVTWGVMEECFLLSDLWLVHLTCFVQWEVSLCDLSRSWERACETEPDLLCFCHQHKKNTSQVACWPTEDETGEADPDPTCSWNPSPASIGQPSANLQTHRAHTSTVLSH